MDPDKRKEARARFKAVAKGEYYPAQIGVEEAKERLKAADSGLDISPLLRAEDEEALKRAVLLLLVQGADPKTLSYFSPLFIEALDTLLLFLQKR